MKKHRTDRPPMTIRYEQPKLVVENGTPVIQCPFCKPTHPLSVSGVSACGTVLELRAAQMVFDGRFNKDIVCIKCKKGGGKLIQFNDAFIHAHDCMPGVFTFADPPKFSKMAKIAFHARPPIKSWMQKIFGEAKAVEEVKPDGTRTGKHLGYFFYQKA